ncbi:endonuclease domain-containing protein [Microbacterium hominis]|uniref:DUF559 domain-containing protein n=1 Tax=Microbacterium hominis TaxID=162426 RepID=A0A7D4THK3_9MICO|nr:DUF559 domain-containing protein [Microbacterium hominis]QKJ20141.1 DUF559 domain-containing protein [Microbacterium hominis]
MSPRTLSPRRFASIAEGVPALAAWAAASGGIVHRAAAERAGFPISVRRAAVRTGAVRKLRRDWLATDDAPPDLVTAAINGGTLTCVSAARRRGWWMPEGAPTGIHLRVDPHASSPVDPDVAVHWSQRIAPARPDSLLESVEDTLAHIAVCLDAESAQVVWNSAVKLESRSPAALQRVRWRTQAARDCADRASEQSDSGLETIAVVRLTPWGIPIQQQVVLLGRPVDILMGERLVIQIDGYAHHASSAQRSRDVAFDAELALLGYTVLRFTYVQIVHDWEGVERTIARAIAAGLHLA